MDSGSLFTGLSKYDSMVVICLYENEIESMGVPN
jgi:hypothetical protein